MYKKYNVLGWTWFFILLLLSLLWTTEYHFGYRRVTDFTYFPLPEITKKKESFKDITQTAAPIIGYPSKLNCYEFDTFDECDAPEWTSSHEQKVNQMFDYSDRFISNIFEQEIFTQVNENRCK